MQNHRSILITLAIFAMLACLALGVPTVADARIETLRWLNVEPEEDRVIGFVVYSGLESREAGLCYDERIDVGWIIPDDDEVFTYDLVVIPEMDSVYVAVTAYDEDLESDFSNEQFRVVPEPSLILQLASGGIGLAWLYRRRT